MGFGFNLFVAFLLVSVTLISIVLRIITGKRHYSKAVRYVWLVVAGIVGLSVLVHLLTDKKDLKKKDYYGNYVINRNYFPGDEANWQYNHFRFEINSNDSIYFYVTNGEKILNTYCGTINTTTAYGSQRLTINMPEHTHHVLTSNPTTYRNACGFNLVFYSPMYNNMYFEKGKWKALE